MLQQRPQPYAEYYAKIGAKLPFFIDWEDSLSVRWPGAGRSVAGAFIRPTFATGLQYACTTPGYTGDDEPPWPTVAAATVNDGSAVWTAQAVTTGSLVATISSSAWAMQQSGSGIVLSAPALNGLVAQVLADFSAAAQGDWDLINTIACTDGGNRPGQWRLKVRA